MKTLFLAFLWLMFATLGNADCAAAAPSRTLQASGQPVATDYTTVLQDVYVAYFGRPADPGGLTYWGNILAAANAPTDLAAFNAAYNSNMAVKRVIDAFGKSQESVALYGTDNATIVNSIYRNLFNRPAEAAGLAYWLNLLNTGVFSQGQAALLIAQGAQSTDAQSVQNKVNIATRFSASLQTTQQVSAYSGLSAGSAIRSVLGTVSYNTDANASLASMLAALNALGSITPNQAARFLTQATFGPRQADINQLLASNYDNWISTQITTPATLQLPQIATTGTTDTKRNTRIEAWWKTAITGPDQLRQRVAFALSEIFVVSDQSDSIAAEVQSVAWYHDLLARNAFGNFRTLLEEVTLSPTMGLYLNMLGNQKPDPANNIHADENYAREVMQLFTIGLVQLNPDGTVKTDGSGKPIPTYSQAEVSGLARVFTGWSWNSADFFDGPANNVAQMIPFADYHDTGNKTIVGGVTVAGSDARSELKLALDTLFNHPNVGPFIGRQLIQRLVTSNPSLAYVQRISKIFNNNGQGVRGDMAAVVRAILLDSEARSDANLIAPAFGKLREPLLMATHLWRAFNASAGNGRYAYGFPEFTLGQAAFSAPSVFNFFNPRFAPPGAIMQAGLVAPEFQQVNAASVNRINNFFADQIYGHDQGNTGAQASDILLDLSPLRALATAADTGALVDQLGLLLMSGQMNATMRQILVSELNQIDASDQGTARILEAIFLIMTSPQYQIQK